MRDSKDKPKLALEKLQPASTFFNKATTKGYRIQDTRFRIQNTGL